MKLWLIAQSGRKRFAIDASLVDDVLPALESDRHELHEVLDLGLVLRGQRTSEVLGNRIIVVRDTGLLAERVLDTLDAEATTDGGVDFGIPKELVQGVVRCADEERLPCLDVPKVMELAPSLDADLVDPAADEAEPAAETCWSKIGVFGSGDCPELKEHVHCRNCPVMVEAGRSVFNQARPPGYLAELAAKRGERDSKSNVVMIQTFVFRSAGRWFGIESEFVERVIAPAPIHRLPFRSNDVLLGTVAISGELLLAFDIGPVFGSCMEEGGQSDRLPMVRMVEVRSQANQFILRVDDVLGIEDFPEQEIENEMPADLPLVANPFVVGMVRLGEITPILLNVELLLKQLAKEMHGSRRHSESKRSSQPAESWTFANQLSELARLAETLERFGEKCGLPPGLIAQLNVCLDELFTNAVSYGYEAEQQDELELSARIGDWTLELILSTGGRAFDPFSDAPEPDLESDLEDRQVGGLGVHLVKQMVDEYSYAHRDGRNIITLLKRLPAAESS